MPKSSSHVWWPWRRPCRRQIWLEGQPGRHGWEARWCLLRSRAEVVLRLVVDQGAVGSELDAAPAAFAAAEALPLYQPRHSPAGWRHVILAGHGWRPGREWRTRPGILGIDQHRRLRALIAAFPRWIPAVGGRADDSRGVVTSAVVGALRRQEDVLGARTPRRLGIVAKACEPWGVPQVPTNGTAGRMRSPVAMGHDASVGGHATLQQR